MSTRLTRNKLKEVIKECLIEILAEGIAPGSSLQRKKTTRKSTARKASQNLNEDTSPKFNKKVKEVARSLTSDPIMSAIFEDTARTTLQEQREKLPHTSKEGDIKKSADIFDKKEIFEGSTNWAALAFAEKKTV
jgi:hypothetical protein